MTLGISFLTWMFISMNADIDDDILTSNAKLIIKQTADFTSFTPTYLFEHVLFFFPGALVDPDAYAPLCHKIAEKGIQVYIIKMPFRLSALGYEKILELNLLKDKTKKYILAGHSQGGKMAAQFVFDYPDFIDLLILLGTTHPRDIDLSNIQIPVLKVYASNDGVASPEKVISNKGMLPKSTQFIEIEGGNHSQFGYYGYQFGDNQAKISRELQQNIIFQNIILFINRNQIQ